MLITGVAGSIGKYIATEFAKKGCIIAGIDKKEFTENIPNIHFRQCDLINFSDTEKTITELVDKCGAFDVIINCAGLIANAPIVSFSEGKLNYHDVDKWNDIISSNLNTTFHVSAICVKYMMEKRKQGVIINFSSIIANGNPGQVAYSAAKAGINGFTKALAKEVGQFGIRAVCIAPGFFDTESTIQNVPEAKLNTLKSAIPAKKLGHPEDIVKTIEYIIDTEYINGAIIELDGGLVI